MQKSDVQIGGRYIAKISNVLTTVRITGTNRYGGYNAVNEATKRDVRIKTAAKLRGPAEPKKAPVTNGNGERMMTENQRAFIDTLLSERVVSDDLMNRYNAAVVENRVTLSAADTFIKHILKCPKVDGSGTAYTPVVLKSETTKVKAKAPQTPVKPNVARRRSEAVMYGRSLHIVELDDEIIKTYDVTLTEPQEDCVAIMVTDLGPCLAAVVNIKNGNVVWSDADGDGNEVDDPETFGHAVATILPMVFPHLND